MPLENNSGAYTALLCSPSAADSRELSSVLRSLRVRAVSATDTAEAIERARDNRFTLILLDLDGDERWESTLRQFRSCAPAAGVLVYSGLCGGPQWLDALDAGAFDFVCKPFRWSELRWILENALKAHSFTPEAAEAAPKAA